MNQSNFRSSSATVSSINSSGAANGTSASSSGDSSTASCAPGVSCSSSCAASTASCGGGGGAPGTATGAASAGVGGTSPSDELCVPGVSGSLITSIPFSCYGPAGVDGAAYTTPIACRNQVRLTSYANSTIVNPNISTITTIDARISSVRDGHETLFISASTAIKKSANVGRFTIRKPSHNPTTSKMPDTA